MGSRWWPWLCSLGAVCAGKITTNNKRSRKTLFALLLALVMTLGLAATAWATEGDETDKIVVIPGG